MRLRFQKHFKYAEKRIIAAGRGIVSVGSRHWEVGPGAPVEIPVGELRRLHNFTDEALIFIEVQPGTRL